MKRSNNLTKLLVRLTRKKEREDSNTKIKDERGISLLTLQKIKCLEGKIMINLTSTN